MNATRQRKVPTLLQRLRADLRGDPRKRVVLIVLLPVLLVVWVPVLTGSAPPPGPIVSPEELQQELAPEDASGATVIDAQLRSRLAALVQVIEQPYVRSWSGGDADHPFVSSFPSPGAPQVGAPDPDRQADEERELAARMVTTCTILSESQGDVAVVDGVPYREGSSIGPFVVLEIGAREVIVEGRFARYELRILQQDEDRP